MTLRPELTELPARIAELPIDERGYPVPWFVPWIGGKPEFRLADTAKWISAVKQKLCWVCGQRLGSKLAFTIGPMCGVNRTTSEPPTHYECVLWSVINCPFLSRPKMVRRENDMPDSRQDPAGISLDRNPGVTLLWVTRDYTVFPDRKGKYLIQVGEPERVEWYREGRDATRAEVEEAVESGLPHILKLCECQRDVLDVMKSVDRLIRLYPGVEVLDSSLGTK